VCKTGRDLREFSPPRSPHLDGDGARLVRLLNLLVAALGRIRADDLPPDDRGGVGPERWEDEGYVYLESNLPGVSESETDLSIHEGRVFIRIEK
jgi:hypothetical protein